MESSGLCLTFPEHHSWPPFPASRDRLRQTWVRQGPALPCPWPPRRGRWARVPLPLGCLPSRRTGGAALFSGDRWMDCFDTSRPRRSAVCRRPRGPGKVEAPPAGEGAPAPGAVLSAAGKSSVPGHQGAGLDSLPPVARACQAREPHLGQLLSWVWGAPPPAPAPHEAPPPTPALPRRGVVLKWGQELFQTMPSGPQGAPQGWPPARLVVGCACIGWGGRRGGPWTLGLPTAQLQEGAFELPASLPCAIWSGSG